MRALFCSIALVLTVSSAQAQEKPQPSNTQVSLLFQQMKQDYRQERIDYCRKQINTLRKLHEPGSYPDETQGALYELIMEAINLKQVTWKDLGLSQNELIALAWGGKLM